MSPSISRRRSSAFRPACTRCSTRLKEVEPGAPRRGRLQAGIQEIHDTVSTQTEVVSPKAKVTELDTVVIRFAGDSGDGMQLTGTQFADTTALVGNDLATLPDCPAEIRAPAGTLAGVSGYQISFSSHDIKTPGDQPNVLVAMNPAALKTNIDDLEEGGILIVDTDAFTEGNLAKASYKSNPLKDAGLAAFRAFDIPLSSLTLQ